MDLSDPLLAKLDAAKIEELRQAVAEVKDITKLHAATPEHEFPNFVKEANARITHLDKVMKSVGMHHAVDRHLKILGFENGGKDYNAILVLVFPVCRAETSAHPVEQEAAYNL